MSNGNSPYSESDRLLDRSIDEMIGICKGISSGGFIVYEQAAALLEWFKKNQRAAHCYPGDAVYKRLIVMLKNSTLSTESELELLNLLDELCNTSPTLPLTEPAPKIIFKDKNFVATGKFKLGNRDFLIDFIQRLGGHVADKNIPLDTNYLLIGNIGSERWIHSTHGRKIERAVFLQSRGYDVAVVSEAHFMKQGAVMFQIANRRLLRK